MMRALLPPVVFMARSMTSGWLVILGKDPDGFGQKQSRKPEHKVHRLPAV
jgi:hypothetical protein